MEFETKAVHHGLDANSNYGETVMPVFQSSAFSYEDAESLENVFEGRRFGHVYSRISNPTVTSLEQRICSLENARAVVAFSSGMAALHALCLALVTPGESFVSSTSLFGGTYNMFRDVLEPLGIDIRYVDPSDLDAIKNAIDETTRFVFIESIGNPKLDVPNIKAISDIAHAQGIPLIVDNTLTTPYLLPAKALGADIVTNSATKYIGTSGTSVGGYVADLGNFNWKESRSEQIAKMAKRAGEFGFMVHFKQHIVTNIGSLMTPFNAFLFNVGLETLALRMDRHCQNALAVAQHLASHSKVSSVNYPGLKASSCHDIANAQFSGRFSGLLTLRLGSKEACFKFLKALKLLKTMTNIGDSRTLMIHASSTLYRELNSSEQEAAGVYDDLIRVSVGLENVADILSDIDQALAQV